MNKVKSYIISLFAGIGLVLIDQFTKLAAIRFLKDKDPFVIWENVFELHYLENKGAAFGMLQGRKTLFLILTLLFLCALVFFYNRTQEYTRMIPLRVISIFLFAGALGNMIDRVYRNYVVDFFYFMLIDFPIFNVADIYITVSGIVLLILFLFYYKDDDFELIFSKKNRGKKDE